PGGPAARPRRTAPRGGGGFARHLGRGVPGPPAPRPGTPATVLRAGPAPQGGHVTLPPIDFSPLDPRDGPGHWDRLGAGIVAAAEPELARRAALAAHPWERALLRHLRPVLAAAAALTL